MIKTLALYTFGWRRVPERFVDRMTGFFGAYMRDRGSPDVDQFSAACLRSLSQLAYQRAKKEPESDPRFIYFFRELELVARVLEDDALGRSVHDDRVRLILEWHRRQEEPNQSVQPTPGSVTPRATEGTSK